MDGQIGFVASSDELIVSIVKLADESTHADVLHRPSGVRRRFGDVMGRCPCVDGILAAIDLQSGVLVVRGGSRPTATRVPLGGCPGDIRIEGESLFAVVGTHLFAIDLGALTWSTNDAAQDIRARYLRPRGASSAELAEVIFAGRLMVHAHPTWGRLTVSLKPGDPPVTKVLCRRAHAEAGLL